MWLCVEGPGRGCWEGACKDAVLITPVLCGGYLGTLTAGVNGKGCVTWCNNVCMGSHLYAIV